MESGSANRIHAGMHREAVVLATCHSFVKDVVLSKT